MNYFGRLTLAALIACLPGVAGAWTASNHHKVAPVSDTAFEVVGRPGSAGQEYWCAAGEYAHRVLKAKVVQRIYLVRGPAPAQTANWNRAVLFSLTPPATGDTSAMIRLSVKQVGSNLSSALAQLYCLRDIKF